MKKTMLAAALLASFSFAAQAWTIDDNGSVSGQLEDKVELTGKALSFGGDIELVNGADLTLDKTTLAVSNTDPLGNFTVHDGSKMTITGHAGINAEVYRQTGGEVTLSDNTANGDFYNLASLGGYEGFELAGGTLTLGEGSRIWVGSADDKTFNDMLFAGGKLVLDGKADNMAIVSTMTGGDYHQRIMFTGTQVEVTGDAALVSNDVNLVGGSITVKEKARLYVLNEKHLSNGTLDTDYDYKFKDESGKAINDVFVIDGGALHLEKGAQLIGRTTGALDSGSVTTDDFKVMKKSSAVDDNGDRTIVAFDNFEMYGGTLTANKISVSEGADFGYMVHSGDIRLVGDDASFTNEGTITFYGLTMSDVGQTGSDLLGVKEVKGEGTFESSGDNLFLDASFEGGKLNATMKDKDEISGVLKQSEYFDAAYDVIASTSSYRDDFTASLLAQMADMGDLNEEDTDVIAAFDDMVDTSAARGLVAYSMAIDAQRLINEGVEARNMMPIAQGGGVWANVFYNSGAADSVYADGYGYDADIYGGQIGFDWTASCGYRLGGVFTIGTGDGNATGGMTDTDIDSDFYGFSLYASKQIERLTFGMDIGYTKVENDLATNSVIGSFDDSIDADVWTVGTRADILAWKGDVFSITPHVGLRYTHVDMDDMGVVEHDTLNLIEMPAGVTIAANFEAASWTVKPALDLTIAPQLGDKDVTYSVLGVDSKADVIETSVFRTKLGVSAEYGNFGLGLNYQYGTSSADRDDHSLNLNAVYRF